MYVVRNRKGRTVTVDERGLDRPPYLTPAGNARKVIYGGEEMDVESTIVRYGYKSITIDRYAPLGENGDI
jgi:hypothetical protein